MKTMTPSTEAAVLKAVDDASMLAQLFLPQFGAYIVLGRALAKAAPSLYNDAVKLLCKAEPTPEDKAEFARKLQALANPGEAS